MSNITNSLQKDIFYSARRLRTEASAAEITYNRAVQIEEPSYRNHIELFDRLETADILHQDAQDLYEEAKRYDELEFETLEILEPELDTPYDAMDYLESEMDVLEQFESVFTEPLKMAIDDYSKFLFLIASSSIYRDGKEIMERREKSKRRRRLQEEAYLTAEKLKFSRSKLDELIERSDKHNIEAATPLIEDQASRTQRYHLTGIGTLRDVMDYRRDNNLLDNGNVTSYNDSGVLEGVEEFDVEDVDLAPLHSAMKKSHDTLQSINKLPFKDDIFEDIDDSEILKYAFISRE